MNLLYMCGITARYIHVNFGIIFIFCFKIICEKWRKPILIDFEESQDQSQKNNIGRNFLFPITRESFILNEKKFLDIV